MLAYLKGYGLVALLAWAVAGPTVTYAWTSFSAYFERKSAVKIAVGEEKAACKTQVTKIQTDLNNQEAENRRLAAEAEASVTPTPADMVERQALCNRSASCRSRQKEGAR